MVLSINSDEIEFKDDSQITKLQWKNILLDKEITYELDLKTVLVVYKSPQNRSTATEIALILGKDSYHNISTANTYFSKRICTYLNIKPPSNSSGGNRWWTIPYCGTAKGDGKYYYVLRLELKEAIDELIKEGKLFIDKNELPILAEEIPEKESRLLFEGAKKQILVNAYERNPQARQLCIQKYGYKCCVCEFDFQEFYGDIGKGYIEVHHLKPLNEINREYQVDSINDLRPVCPNCHSILHRANLTIEELRDIVEKNQSKS